MAIDLKGTDDPNDEYREPVAFALGSKTTLRYLEADPDPKYQGYLVKVISFNEEEINFQGVSLANGTPSGTTRTVKYKDMKTMWLPGPSSNLSTYSTTNCYIILFLSDDYTNAKSDLQAAKGGGGKWPKGSGLAIINLYEKVQDLEKAVNNVRPDLEAFRATLPDKDKSRFTKAFEKLLR